MKTRLAFLGVLACLTLGAESQQAQTTHLSPAGRRPACRRIGTAKCRTYDVRRPDCNIRERRGFVRQDKLT